MNAQKFTQKSLEAIQEAQNLAIENNNMQIEEEHLVAALLQQRDGLIPQLLKKMHVDCDAVQRAVAEKISRIPGVTGPGREAGKIYVSADVDAVLTAAEKEADRMKDEYVSVEHIMLAILNRPNNAMKDVFQRFGIEKNAFLTALSSVRGNTRVTSDTPEETYDALSKYGQDLVELAKNRRTRRRQNRYCGRPGTAYCARGRAEQPQRPQNLLPGYGRADCRREIPRRI